MEKQKETNRTRIGIDPTSGSRRLAETAKQTNAVVAEVFALLEERGLSRAATAFVGARVAGRAMAADNVSVTNVAIIDGMVGIVVREALGEWREDDVA